jgi:hypothetical protein
MISSRLTLLIATPHLNSLPFTKGRGGRNPVGPKLTINEHYPTQRACFAPARLARLCRGRAPPWRAVAPYEFMPESDEALVWDAPSVLRWAVQWVLV